MGFFGTLGDKLSGAAHSLGQKAKFVAKKVGDVSDVVGKVASGVAAGAGTLAAGAAMIGAEPVAAGLLGVAGVAKGIQGAASGVSAAAHAAGRFGGAVDIGAHAIDDLRKGDFKGAAQMAKEAGMSAKQGVQFTQSLKKQIERKK